MFAHQVIEDLQKKSYRPPADDKQGWFRNVPNIIRSAQHFHVDGYKHIRALFPEDNDNYKAFKETKYLKLPYDKLWIDCFTEAEPVQTIYRKHANKYAALIMNRKKEWEIFLFVHAPFVNTWIMIPRVVNVKFGEEDIEPELTYQCFNYENLSLSEDMEEEINAGMQHILIFIPCVVRLLNCKNIQTEKIIAPVKLNKKRLSSGKQIIFDYHVLNVMVPSNKKRGYQEQSIPLSHNRVHLCRGHFKEYTSEHPLLGKHVGLYWWQPSVRGQNKTGIVMKDYNIMPQEAIC